MHWGRAYSKALDEIRMCYRDWLLAKPSDDVKLRVVHRDVELAATRPVY